MSDTPLLSESETDLVDLYKRSMGSGNYGSPTDQEAREEEDARLILRSAIRALQRQAEADKARIKELEHYAEEHRIRQRKLDLERQRRNDGNQGFYS